MKGDSTSIAHVVFDMYTPATLAQEFTFQWATRGHPAVTSDAYEAAAATLRGMAGRLTALTVPRASNEHLWGMLEAGPQLAGALSSLRLGFSIDEELWRLHAATHAVLAVSARLQHLDLGMGSDMYYESYSAAQMQAADAALQHMMRSLPRCQSLRLSCCGVVSHQVIGRELLRAAPDLLSLTFCIGHLDEQVNHCVARDVACHRVHCRPVLQHCRSSGLHLLC